MIGLDRLSGESKVAYNSEMLIELHRQGDRHFFPTTFERAKVEASCKSKGTDISDL